MAVTFPGCGTVEYNGFEFPATFQLKLNSNAVYDEANLRLKYYSNVLNVTFIISQEMVPDEFPSVTNGTDLDTVDNYIAAIRQTLQTPRKSLKINYQGLGFKTVEIKPPTFDTSLNVYTEPNTVGDVAGGPLPRTFNIEPIGSNQAVRVTWSVEFFTLRCLHDKENAILESQGLLSLVEDIRFAINEQGISTITYSGYVEFAFALNAKGEYRLPDWENVRDSTTIDDIISRYQQKGFRCTKQDFMTSKDRKRVEYTVVFEEQPSGNALFPYSIKVDGRHKVKSSLYEKEKLSGTGFFNWTNNINVTVTMAPGYPGSLAYAIFLWILNQRFGRIGTDRIVNPETTDEQAGYGSNLTKPNNILLSLEMEENLYNRTHTFKAEYLGTYKLSRFFYQSGLFTPIYTVRDKDGKYPWQSGYIVDKDIHRQQWSLWTKTVGGKVQNLGGYRKEALSGTAILFDPCPAKLDFQFSYDGPSETDGILEYYEPVGEDKDNEDSYLAYEIDFELIENTRNYPIGIQTYGADEEAYLRTTEEELKINRASAAEGNTLHLYGKSGSGVSDADATAIDSMAGGSSFVLLMTGFGIRYQQEVPVPAVVGINIGGSTVYLKRIGARTMQKKLSPGNTSLHLAAWKIAYSVPYSLKGRIQAFDGNNNEINTGGRMIQTPPAPTA